VSVEAKKIEQLIEAHLPDTKAYVEGDGTHFTALVISPHFANLSRIRKQQMVYAAVQDHLLNRSLHALSVKAMTPDEWETIEKTSNIGH
jgi:acid stress-induced BolA-like protein IbaG/YrbA